MKYDLMILPSSFLVSHSLDRVTVSTKKLELPFAFSNTFQNSPEVGFSRSRTLTFFSPTSIDVVNLKAQRILATARNFALWIRALVSKQEKDLISQIGFDVSRSKTGSFKSFFPMSKIVISHSSFLCLRKLLIVFLSSKIIASVTNPAMRFGSTRILHSGLSSITRNQFSSTDSTFHKNSTDKKISQISYFKLSEAI